MSVYVEIRVQIAEAAKTQAHAIRAALEGVARVFGDEVVEVDARVVADVEEPS